MRLGPGATLCRTEIILGDKVTPAERQRDSTRREIGKRKKRKERAARMRQEGKTDSEFFLPHKYSATHTSP